MVESPSTKVITAKCPIRVEKTFDGIRLLCRVCKKRGKRTRKVRTYVVLSPTTWVDVPYITMTTDSLRKHTSTNSHKYVVKLKAQVCLSHMDGGIISSV